MRFRTTIELGGNKRRHVLSIEGAKTAETRERRITKAATDLRDGPG
jgi:uncharacterized protein YdeI (YjbR/CyaY-like superfamily)